MRQGLQVDHARASLKGPAILYVVVSIPMSEVPFLVLVKASALASGDCRETTGESYANSRRRLRQFDRSKSRKSVVGYGIDDCMGETGSHVPPLNWRNQLEMHWSSGNCVRTSCLLRGYQLSPS